MSNHIILGLRSGGNADVGQPTPTAMIARSHCRQTTSANSLPSARPQALVVVSQRVNFHQTRYQEADRPNSRGRHGRDQRTCDGGTGRAHLPNQTLKALSARCRQPCPKATSAHPQSGSVSPPSGPCESVGLRAPTNVTSSIAASSKTHGFRRDPTTDPLRRSTNPTP